MPLQKLQFQPGVNRESTNYSNEGGFFSGDKIRFRSGYAEKIGGWQNITSATNTFKGVARVLWNYITRISQNMLGVGTNQKVYVELGGQYNDITPLQATNALGSDPFSVTSGSLLVTVTDAVTNPAIGTYVAFSSATAVGGITISGSYEVVSAPTSTTYQFIAASAATSTATGGGSLTTAAYDIDAGPAVETQGVGWGGPPWGQGGWGSNTNVNVSMRLWSMFNYGDDLIFNERNGNIYYWTKDTINWPRAVPLSTKANSEVKYETTASFVSGSVSIILGDVTALNTGCVIAGSGIPVGSFVPTTWDGSTSVTIQSATTGSGTVPVTVSYAGRHVPEETLFTTDSAINDFVICFGTTPYSPIDFSPTQDPMLVRWSDQDNPFEWVPSILNQSGEQRLSHGSYIVTATQTRQEIVIFSDMAVYSMQYLGPPFVWGITLLDMDISIASQNSVISVNNVVYWMGTDKFYMYSGRVQALPCTLRQFVYSDINKDQFAQVTCGHNEGYNEIWWFYASADSTVNNRYVVYNYLENLWYYGTLERTAWAEHTTRGYPLAAFSVQNTYLDTAIGASDTTISLINAVTLPEEGTVIIGSEEITYTGRSNNNLTGCVRGVNGTTAASHVIYEPVTYKVPNQVMFHEFGVDDASTDTPTPIEAFIESSDFDIGDGHNFGFVYRILPDVNFTGSTASSPSITLTVKPRVNSGTNYGNSDTLGVTRSVAVPVQQFTGQVYTRIRGRQMAFRVASSDLGVAWQMGAMRVDIRPDGRR